MINNSSELKKYLIEDAMRAGMPDKYTLLGFLKYKIALLIREEQACVLHYLFALRKLEYWTNHSQGLLSNCIRRYWLVKHNRLGMQYGIHIGVNMVGYGLKIAHFAGGVIINCNKMGNYCTISTGVVVGNKDNAEARPTIGNNVEMAMGSKIYGDIRIGDNVRIAPNAVVFKDVPDNTAVGGNPAIIIKRYDK